MRRFGFALVAAVVALSACSDQKATAPADPPALPGQLTPALSLDGQPADSTQIESLILQLYQGINSGNGPLNSAQTRWRQIAQLYVNCWLNPPQSPCNSASAQANAYILADDILSRYKAGDLNDLTSYSSASGTGTGAAVTDLINLLLRYVGLDDNVCSFGTGVDCDAEVYQPGSPAIDIIAPSGQAGIRLPAGTGTVTRPTIISVSRIVDPSVLLTTELDQYLFRYQFTSSSGQGALPDDPFLQNVYVEVCLATDNTYPTGAIPRLVLAHDVAEPTPYENIQILPPGVEFLTNCGTLASNQDFSSRFLRSLNSGFAWAFAPRPLYAMGVGTGTSGTTKTLSPFSAVDSLGYITPNAVPAATAPEGGSVTPPSVRVVSPAEYEDNNPTGPGMEGIPVTFAITAGGGCFASPCVSGSPTTLTVNSDANGYASVPAWTVGQNTNTVTATASITCTAPVAAGTAANCGTIANPAGGAAVSFSVVALPASQVNFNGTTLTLLTSFASNTYAPGTPFTATVLVQTSDGQTVPGSSAPVTLLLTNGGTLVCPSGCTVNAVNGVATFTGVYITNTGSFQLYATSPNLTSAPAAPTGGFSVVAPASSASAIAVYSGNNQTAPDGSTLSGANAPTVRVTDTYGNPVGGVGVSFAIASGGGSIGSATATTNATGLASTTWTILEGTNTLVGTITALGSLPAATFTATGTPVNVVLVSCPANNGTGDEFSRAFYVTKNGVKRIKQVTVYLAANDPANVPTDYQVELTMRADRYDGALIGQKTVTTRLNGASSQNLGTNFDFANVAVPSGTKVITFQLRLVTNPDKAKVFFALGPTTCKEVTETANATPPLSTALRKGVGLRITGN